MHAYIDIFITPENKGKSRILNLGCGNSVLGEELWNAGYGEVQNIDYSASVITFMTTLFSKRFPNIEKSKPKCEYKEMDAKELKYEDNSFDLVIDKGSNCSFNNTKGCLDAFFCGGETDTNIKSILCEVSRVLKPGNKSWFIVDRRWSLHVY